MFGAVAGAGCLLYYAQQQREHQKMMIFLLFVFFFSSFHFIFPPYKKNTRPVKESLRSCARQSSEDRRLGRRSKGGFQLLLDFFFLFSFSTKEDRLILFKKGIRKKDTHKWRERESRKKPCGCELCPFYTIPGG